MLDFFNFDIVLTNVNIIKNKSVRGIKIKFVWLNKTTDKNSVDNIFFSQCFFSFSFFFITHKKERGERGVAAFKNIFEKETLSYENGRFNGINTGRIKNI